MAPLDELLLLAEERDMALVVHPAGGGVCAALVDSTTEAEHAACGLTVDEALEALVKLIRYQRAEGLIP